MAKFVNSGEIQGYYETPKPQKGVNGDIQGYVPTPKKPAKVTKPTAKPTKTATKQTVSKDVKVSGRKKSKNVRKK